MLNHLHARKNITMTCVVSFDYWIKAMMVCCTSWTNDHVTSGKGKQATYNNLVSWGFYTPVFRRDLFCYGNVRLGLHPTLRPSASFPLFSPTCCERLRWNFVCEFLFLNLRSSLSVINFRQFLYELCSFWSLTYWKYTVFRTFLLQLWQIELEFCTRLSGYKLKITFEYSQFA